MNYTFRRISSLPLFFPSGNSETILFNLPINHIMKKTIIIFFTLAFTFWESRAQSEFVNVDGYLMHVETVGVDERKPGQPVIIFENPSLGTIRDWDSIFYEVAKVGPVIRYDRSGLGKSEWNGKKPSPENIAEHLYDLLQTLEVKPPYVLVGHSWGTQLVRKFADLYPEETSGLVIVDPGLRPSTMKAAFKDIDFPPEKGLQEYLQQIRVKNDYQGFSDEEWENLTAMGDWFASPELPPTPQVPVAALIAGKDGPGPPLTERFSFDFQEFNRALYPHEMKRLFDWVRDSPDGILIIADRSGHFIQNDEPDLVLTAIKYVVDRRQSQE